MAIKGLSELLTKHKAGEIDEATFEAELNKALATEWIPKTKFNEVLEGRKLAEASLANANKTLDDLKAKAGLSDEYKAQIDKLNAESVKAQESFKAQLHKMRLDTAIDNGLRDAKSRNHKATRALLDESKISIADDGSVSGLKEQLEAIAKENGFLFEASEEDNKKNPTWGGGDKKNPSGPTDALEAAMFAAAGLNY